jgi:hypothetical protein
LLNGIIYTTWASHCDIAPYTSWIIAYDETSLQQVRVPNLDPNGGAPSSILPDGSGNAFWSSGAGPAADANGFIYALTANGPFETTLTANGFPGMGDYGDTFLKLSTAGSLSVSDYFTPFDQAKAAANDTDLGSGGAVVLPDMVDHNGAIRHLAIGAGKDTNIYLVDRDNMGKFNPASNSNIYRELAGALPGGEFATAAYFNGAVYYGPVGGALRKFTFTEALLDNIPAAMTSTVFSYPGVTPSISSSGNNAGIVWAYENPNSGGPAVLHAYKASDLTELYNSNQRPGRDHFGVANKFITPTICNGKVLVGTTNSVGVFGLLSVQKDFNGDAYADLVWENASTGERLMWLLKDGVYSSTISLPTASPSWHIAGVGDFLGNGQSDLVLENTVTGQHVIWILNNGVLQYGIELPAISPGWHVVGAGDFNGDGYADLVLENTTSGERVIWVLNKGVYSSTISLPTAPPSWHVAGVGDFLGNGQSDLVLENTVTNEHVVWILNKGVLQYGIALRSMSPGWRVAGAADFNDDGYADLVLQNASLGQRVIWLLNQGVYSSSIALPNGSAQWQIVDH